MGSGLSTYLDLVGHASEQLLDVAAVRLSIADARGELQVAWSSDEVLGLNRFAVHENEGPAVDCYATGRPVVNVERTEARRRWPAFSTRLIQKGSMHALPLRVGGVVVGVLSLYFSRPQALSDDELSACRVLIQVAGIGLQQADDKTRRDGGQRPMEERYRIDELLGRGGMAEVHLAHDVALDRVVAIKTPRPDRMDQPGQVERFRREGRTAARMRHPNIVSVLGAGDSETVDVRGDKVRRPYLVMEHVAGVTLRGLVNTGGAVHLEEAVRIVADVLSTLTYIHERDVVHGDLTATNVLLSTDGTVKLTDFGSSHESAGLDLQMTQSVEVTLAYSSPERAQGLMSDQRADLYSAGCVLYELLTGQTPFIDTSPVDLAYQQVHAAPEPPSTLQPHIGAQLDNVVLRALAKAPGDRYQSAQEFRRDLLVAGATGERRREGVSAVRSVTADRTLGRRRSPGQRRNAESRSRVASVTVVGPPST